MQSAYNHMNDDTLHNLSRLTDNGYFMFEVPQSISLSDTHHVN